MKQQTNPRKDLTQGLFPEQYHGHDSDHESEKDLVTIQGEKYTLGLCNGYKDSMEPLKTQSSWA